jgi:signal transduction histidine kinase
VVRGWHTPVRWLQANTFNPSWLPPRWQNSWIGYVVALLVQVVAFLLTFLLVLAYPGFPFPSALALLGIVLVALNFGAGPSLLATGIASVLIDGVIVPKNSSWPLASVQNGIALFLLVGAGAVMSLVASRSERAHRVAESATRDRSAFLAIAAHELKTPLMVIKGSAQLLARRFRQAATAKPPARDSKTLIEEARPVLGRIETGVDRIDRLIEEMLALSAIQAGRLEFHLAPCALASVVSDAVNDQREQFPERRIMLNVPDAPIVVLADADRIGQVVTGYLSNALKYAPEDQPVTVHLEATSDDVRVSVHDEGPGLPPDQQERVWEAFYQAPGVETQSGSSIGLGLGLSICRTIVERHGGRVGVESAVGQGATFWFTLPLAPTGAPTVALRGG